MAWFGSRTTSERRGRRGGTTGTAAAAVALATTLGLAAAGATPATPWEDDTAEDIVAWSNALAGFVASGDRYTAFETRESDATIYPSGINDQGQITGEYVRSDGESAFVRSSDGRLTTFDVRGAKGTEASKINDGGQIVGRYSEDTPLVDDSSRVRGFVRSRRGAITRLDYPDAQHTLPTGINDRGDVVGYFVDSGGTTHGFVWRDGRFTTLDVPRATAPTPVDINDRGDVVGVYLDAAGAPKGFLLSKGRYRTIAAPGAPTTIPFGINDDGQIVGYTADDLEQTGARGFLLSEGPDGPFTPISVPGAPKTVALGISDRGDVVGLHENPDPDAQPPGDRRFARFRRDRRAAAGHAVRPRSPDGAGHHRQLRHRRPDRGTPGRGGSRGPEPHRTRPPGPCPPDRTPAGSLRDELLRHLPDACRPLLTADCPPGYVDARTRPGHRLQL